MRTFLACLFGFLCGAVPHPSAVHAENQAPAGEPGRYAMTPAEGGFLRLDTQTGVVSFCTVTDGLSLCLASADEKAALEAEISRLRRENAELRSTLSGSPAAQPKASSSLPSEEEFERTLSFTERFLRRMLKVFREEAQGDKDSR